MLRRPVKERKLGAKLTIPAAPPTDFGEYHGAAPHVFTMMLDVAANDGTDWIMGGVGIACPESDVTRPGAGQNRQTSSDEAKQVAAAAMANASQSASANASASAAVLAAGGGSGAGGAAVAGIGAGGSAPAPSDGTPEWFLPFMRENFGRQPGGPEFMRVIEAILANGKVTPMPQYHFAAPRVVNRRVVLVGDAAHMGVPRTAVGAHTAVLDGMALLEA